MDGTFLNAQKKWLKLTEEQQRCANYSGDKTLVIKAYAGGGKSTVIQYIAKKYIEEYEENYNPKAYNKVLVLTYNKPLASATAQILGINGDRRRFIKVKTVNKHLYDICVDIGLDRKTVCDDKTQKQFIREALKQYGRANSKCRLLDHPACDETFWQEEIEWMKSMNVTTVDYDYYMSLERKGRGTNLRMSETDRADAFRIFCCYRHILKQNGMVDWGDFALYVARHGYQISTKHLYDHVLIDEAQDFSLAQMKAVMNIFREDMTIAMDNNQKLYNKQWIPKDLGIDITIKRLTQSMRTTAQIDRFAESLRKGNDKFLSEDDRSDHVVPKFKGPKPNVVLLKSIEDEKNLLLDIVKKWLKDFSDQTIAIIASKNNQLDNIATWLKEAGIPIEFIKGDQDFNITRPGVKLVTTHSAKGLEFTRVIIPQFVDGNYPYSYLYRLEIDKERQDYEVRERNRTYVAMTRAQQRLVVTCVKDKASPFLKDIDKSTYDLIDNTTQQISEDFIEDHEAEDDEDDGTLLALTDESVKEGDSSETVVDDSITEEFERVLFDILGCLKEREERIIRLRYGLEDGKRHTLEEIGKEFGVTRERIRQLEQKGLRKLRTFSRRDRIRAYVDPELDIEEILRQFMEKTLVIRRPRTAAERLLESSDSKYINEDGSISDDLPIEELGLSDRPYNCIKGAGVNTLGELCSMSVEDVRELGNFGITSMREVRSVLLEYDRALKK
ncbi:RNA polymerase sigma factor, sigma-70 family [Butyrivibrio sp. ob235]|uniref:sigma-70 family RNA polymerase sigma factor n=1 Tax=Butyrivibrio sp. ob235 TaxID=1761780 RepID=UPI0008B1F337|nr:sigma-70 family RNA polymerase sigma factor [Butyrivibrio sp. ob235]SEL76497.1 RNA polymerase sigma factor, sigma-70 family [Butyrivibrio sp. ob235]